MTWLFVEMPTECRRFSRIIHSQSLEIIGTYLWKSLRLINTPNQNQDFINTVVDKMWCAKKYKNLSSKNLLSSCLELLCDKNTVFYEQKMSVIRSKYCCACCWWRVLLKDGYAPWARTDRSSHPLHLSSRSSFYSHTYILNKLIRNLFILLKEHKHLTPTAS